MDIERDTLDATLAEARRQLLAWRLPSGHWEGELCSSALSTATAVSALALTGRERHQGLIEHGLGWLAANANPDGGWGDSVLSRSNISATAVCWAAFAIAGDGADEHRPAAAMAEAWLERAAGGVEPARLAQAIRDRYGDDRTFSVPILATCAIAGKLGADGWRWVEPLPFELAACPHRWLKWLRLPVVSYALPALVAIGNARFHHRPPLNPIARLARLLARRKAFAKLTAMQPESGGFLEATPLTSFVLMNLAAAGLADHPVAARGAEFLRRSARGDGSWPIDTNLATWVTTLSVNALAACPAFARATKPGFGGRRRPDLADVLPEDERRAVLDWLLGQQHLAEHPFTAAEPGGWAWTDLSGGVPDADDTAGALLALRSLGLAGPRVTQAAARGVEWLLGLQNRDGGFPTFCRGWGRLPFDRSGADLTAHALLALDAWLDDLAPPLKARAEGATRRGIAYLASVQRHDGAWVPLWFGNEHAPSEENPVFGTARVLMALSGLARRSVPGVEAMQASGARWLLAAQNADGGWGGAPDVPSSLEETALAVDALAGQLLALTLCVRADRRTLRVPFGPTRSVEEVRPHAERRDEDGGDGARDHLLARCVPGTGELGEANFEAAVAAGARWLIRHTERGRSFPPSPIGFYFANLWYYERLYPLAFTVSALGRVRSLTT